ncbi:hypothetical protein [Niallia sp. NCCP-28]|uniref:hypothetical protein n=1 Tax=Niallia sp. NCCP-28 TaxID=2934712 RepID=UPI002088CABA|nr:hypothetical protein [Niallia sp. NCCP-28]GKU83049.1 hypothetical protein NCCP28_24450 [Niallia sp. NCCP-28]
MTNLHETQKIEEDMSKQDNSIYVSEEIEMLGKVLGEKELQPFSISSFPKPIRLIGYLLLAFVIAILLFFMIVNVFL